MTSRIKQEILLDQIHVLVGERLTLQQQLKCYTEKEIQRALEDKDLLKEPMLFEGLKGYYDLANLLFRLGIS